MNKSIEESTERVQQQRTQLLSNVMAIILVLLVAAFFITLIHNMTTLDKEADTINSGPYPVSISAGHVETLLVQSRTLADRFLYTRSPDAIRSVQESYDSINSDLFSNLYLIYDNHTTSNDEAEALMHAYATLTQHEHQLLIMVHDPNISTQEMSAFINENIEPTVNTMLDINAHVLDESTASVKELYENVSHIGTNTIMFTIILLVAVIISLFVYLNLLRISRKREQLLMNNLHDALHVAEHASAAKSQFLSNMSHDIRTPMNAIVGLTNIAQTHSDDQARVEDCLNRIDVSSKQLLSLINDILDMSRIESGKMTLNESAFSFPDLVYDIITVTQPQAVQKNLGFDVVTSPIEHEEILGDPLRLSQVLLNLLGNAIKYTPEDGHVLFTIIEEDGYLKKKSDGTLVPTDSLEQDALYKNYCFIIKDDGMGMTPEFLEHIFEPFEREETEAVIHTEGAGLGMSIVGNIVKMMQGTIQVESEVNKGSTFTVTIPLKLSASKPLEIPESFTNKHVLVVDDEAGILKTVSQYLTDLGIDNAVAQTKEEAQQRIVQATTEGKPFECAIVELIPGAIDNLALVRALQTAEHEACLEADSESSTEIATEGFSIVLAAYDYSEVETKARQQGVAGFISKPIFKSSLCQILSAVWSPEQHAQAESVAKPTVISGRILLVEDNEINRLIAIELITQLGSTVEVATDGIEAFDAITSHEPDYYDLVFMDMQMPRMGGEEATRQIRQFEDEQELDNPGVPIIAMTANAFEEDKKRALAAGMNGFMTKPIDIKELRRTLIAYLH